MGSNDYLGGLQQTIQDTYPDMVETHILSSILPAVLLALVARNTNVMFTTLSVVDLQKSTTKMLSTVFGLQVKRVRIRSLQSPNELLMSLFVPASPTSSSVSSHKRRSSYSNVSRSRSTPYPPSSHFTEGSDSTAPQPLPSPPIPQHKSDPLPRETDAQATLHLPQVIVISGLEHAGRAAHLALADALRTRRIVLEPNDGNGSLWNLPDGFFVIFISGTGDGHERPAIHTTLLDHFAFSITLNSSPAPPPTPSPRVRPLPLSPVSPRPPLLSLDQIPHPDTSAMAPLIQHYVTALLTAARHHPELDGTLLTARCVRDAEKIVRASGIVFRESEEHAIITELHVRRVLPPVLAHRLRVRDGPREQIMGALWKEAGVHKWGELMGDTHYNRRTVKDILAEILAEV